MYVLIDVPWRKHLCFLDSAVARKEARDAVQQAAKRGAGHSSLFAYSIGNEIPEGPKNSIRSAFTAVLVTFSSDDGKGFLSVVGKRRPGAIGDKLAHHDHHHDLLSVRARVVSKPGPTSRREPGDASAIGHSCSQDA
jgi:hypothetical protein